MSKKRACWSTGASPQAKDERNAQTNGGIVLLTQETANNDDIKQWVTEKDDFEDGNKTDEEIRQINNQIMVEIEERKSQNQDSLPGAGANKDEQTGVVQTEEKGTQDYSGYFPSDSIIQKYDLVPRVDPDAIRKRNEALVKQALNTRQLVAIPKNKIKTKKVSRKQW